MMKLIRFLLSEISALLGALRLAYSQAHIS